jgi:hypothetical protein
MSIVYDRGHNRNFLLCGNWVCVSIESCVLSNRLWILTRKLSYLTKVLNKVYCRFAVIHGETVCTRQSIQIWNISFLHWHYAETNQTQFVVIYFKILAHTFRWELWILSETVCTQLFTQNLKYAFQKKQYIPGETLISKFWNIRFAEFCVTATSRLYLHLLQE